MPRHAQQVGNKFTGDKPFSIEVERREGAAVIRLTGACTMNVSAQLGERLVQLASEPVRLLVLDMAGLDFIESRGLGGIIAGYLRCRRHQGEVRIVSPPPAILHLLELTRLTQLFGVYDTTETALAAGIDAP